MTPAGTSFFLSSPGSSVSGTSCSSTKRLLLLPSPAEPFFSYQTPKHLSFHHSHTSNRLSLWLHSNSKSALRLRRSFTVGGGGNRKTLSNMGICATFLLLQREAQSSPFDSINRVSLESAEACHHHLAAPHSDDRDHGDVTLQSYAGILLQLHVSELLITETSNSSVLKFKSLCTVSCRKVMKLLAQLHHPTSLVFYCS